MIRELLQRLWDWFYNFLDDNYETIKNISLTITISATVSGTLLLWALTFSLLLPFFHYFYDVPYLLMAWWLTW